jgi:hypothetical protein
VRRAAARAAWYTLIGAFALGSTSASLAGHDDTDPDSVKLVRIGVTAVLYGLGALVLPLLRRVDGLTATGASAIP